MKRKKKAVGYVCPIPIPGTGEVIGVEAQKDKIRNHAESQGIDVLYIFEDSVNTQDVRSRPAVQALLNSADRFETVLVERIWAMSRQKQFVEPVLQELDKMDVTLTATSYMWDMVSQQVRHRYAVRLVDKARKEMAAQAEAKALKSVA